MSNWGKPTTNMASAVAKKREMEEKKRAEAFAAAHKKGGVGTTTCGFPGCTTPGTICCPYTPGFGTLKPEYASANCWHWTCPAHDKFVGNNLTTAAANVCKTCKLKDFCEACAAEFEHGTCQRCVKEGLAPPRSSPTFRKAIPNHIPAHHVTKV